MKNNNKFTPERINKIKTQILTTKGMSSAVFDQDPGDKTKYIHIGHIFAGDYDGEDFLFVLDECMKNQYKNGLWSPMFPGVSAIFKSSETGYHMWNLTIRNLEENGLLGLQSHVDQVHNSISYRRHCWILRITPKLVGDDENKIYKPAPELCRVLWQPTDIPQSLPHFRLLQALNTHSKYDIKMPSTKNINLEGTTLDIEEYITITDRLKSNWKRLNSD